MSITSKFVVAIISLFFMLVPAFAFAQDATDTNSDDAQVEYTTIQNLDLGENLDPYKAKRIGTDIGFAILYDLLPLFLNVVLSLNSAPTDCVENCGSDDADKKVHAIGATGLLVTALVPAFAVHTSHAIWKGNGSLGWTYGGSIIGTVAGVGLGALGFAEDRWLHTILMPVCGFVLGTVGAILGYELTNSKNIESSRQASVKNFHPVIELSDERKVFGFGFEF